MSKWKEDTDGTFFDANFDPEKGVFTYERAVDIAPIINENLKRQKDPKKGWTDSREGAFGRHVGDIPEFIYYRDILPKFREFEKEFTGDDLRMKKHSFLLKFLTEHPEYRTVENIVTHNVNDGNILIK